MPTLLGLTCRRPCQNRTVRSRYSTWFINKSRKESHRHGSSHRQASDRAIERANAAVLLSMVWAALAACVIGAVIYDIASWLGGGH
jgi:hypothetical protein